MNALLAAGLVDEIRTFTFPVLLGTGKRLFADGAKPAGLKLAHSRVSPAGMVAATYVIDGKVKTGDFTHHTPSAAELARRDKLKREDSA